MLGFSQFDYPVFVIYRAARVHIEGKTSLCEYEIKPGDRLYIGSYLNRMFAAFVGQIRQDPLYLMLLFDLKFTQLVVVTDYVGRFNEIS